MIIVTHFLYAIQLGTMFMFLSRISMNVSILFRELSDIFKGNLFIMH